MPDPDRAAVLNELLSIEWFEDPLRYVNLHRAQARLRTALETGTSLFWDDVDAAPRLRRELVTASAPRRQSIIGKLLGRDRRSA